jgi:hypothetical protein
VALVGGSTIHKWELVATSANKSHNDVVKSTCHALTSSWFSTLSSSFSNIGCSTFLGMLSLWSPISPLISLSTSALRVLLRVLSILGSKGINSKFRDLQPCIHLGVGTGRDGYWRFSPPPRTLRVLEIQTRHPKHNNNIRVGLGVAGWGRSGKVGQVVRVGFSLPRILSFLRRLLCRFLFFFLFLFSSPLVSSPFSFHLLRSYTTPTSKPLNRT